MQNSIGKTLSTQRDIMLLVQEAEKAGPPSWVWTTSKPKGPQGNGQKELERVPYYWEMIVSAGIRPLRSIPKSLLFIFPEGFIINGTQEPGKPRNYRYATISSGRS